MIDLGGKKMKIGLVPSREYAGLADNDHLQFKWSEGDSISAFLRVNLSIHIFIDKYTPQNISTESLEDPNAICLLMCYSIC